MQHSGQVIWKSGKAYVRVRLASKQRVMLAIGCTKKEEVDERAREVAAVVDRPLDAGRSAIVPELARDMASARTSAEVRGVRAVVEAICSGAVDERKRLDAAITCRQFGEKWTSGELHRLFPKRIREKKTADQDKQTLEKWVYPHIGDVPLAALKSDHLEDVLNRVPANLSDHLARHVAQAMSRLLRLAVYPAKLIAKSPAPPGFVPQIRSKKARTYLFPSEDRALLGCREVYVVLRLLYGMLQREGMRVDEVLSLEFVDVDLDRGLIHLDKNKTDDPRSWALDPSVAEALRRWRDHFHPKPQPGSRVFVYPPESKEPGNPIDGAARADIFRANLKKAGLARPQLFAKDASRRPACIHDLRATFVTVSLARGRTETWVADRTGHKSSTMIIEYRRQARTHAELDLGALTPLHDAIPEIAAVRARRGPQAGVGTKWAPTPLGEVVSVQCTTRKLQ